MKRILLIATTPFKNDGLTKIELDVLKYNKDYINFEIASGFGYDNEIGNKLIDEGYITHNLPSKKKVFSYMKGIKNIVKHGKYDKIYIHGNSAMMLIEALPARIGGNAEVITHCHNTKSKYTIIHYIFKPLFNLIVDKKIACSQMAAEWAYFGKNIEVIINGVDLNKFKYDEIIRKKVREKLGLCDDIIIGHIGRFTEQKNHKRLISIFEKYNKKNNNSKLLLIGDGELRNEIKKIIKDKNLEDRTIFVSSTDKPHFYLQAMDVMVMPSLYEGLSVVAIEAQANGLPIVLSDTVTNETFATKCSYKCSLKEDDEKWVETICDIDLKRIDTKERLLELGFDFESMMKKISNELTE